MKSINLYSYTRVKEEYASDFFNIMSNSEHKSKVRPHEYVTTQILVDELVLAGAAIELLDGFFASFTIKQIGKEFDLLKIEQDKHVLDIELKCEPVDRSEMSRQLKQNRYYLGHLASDCALFTFVGSTKELYRLIDDTFERVDMGELIEAMREFDNYLPDGIEKLFTPNCYLISPLNTPQRFLDGNYFLTQNQQEIRNQILETAVPNQQKAQFFGIRGSSGTGKTLLLYDLAKAFAEANVTSCIIHYGQLCEGQKYLNAKESRIDFYPVTQIKEEDTSWLDRYQVIFVDETQRMQQNALQQLISYISAQHKIAMFSYIYEQPQDGGEGESEMPAYLLGIEGFTEFRLSKRIRTSVEIASFCETLTNLGNTAHGYMNYSNIHVLYANDTNEAIRLIRYYSEVRGYTFIELARDAELASADDIDTYTPASHSVLGQEFDKVMIVMDERFGYDGEGRLVGRMEARSGASRDERSGNRLKNRPVAQPAPEPDYLLDQLLYQNVSRARENLVILIVNNQPLFENVASIKLNMLEKYQYRTGIINADFSRKTLNKLVRTVKHNLGDMDKKDAEIVNDNVDIIVSELLSVDLRKKIVRNSISYLELIMDRYPAEAEICRAVWAFVGYVREVG